MNRLIPILVFSVCAFLIASLGYTSAQNEIIKNGVSVELIDNTDFCDTKCYSIYKVCYPSIDIANDISFRFRDEDNKTLVTNTFLKKYNFTTDVVADCRIVNVFGRKGKFENVDNIPCFKGICFDEFAWWNSSFQCREEINTTNITLGNTFSVNNTFGINGETLWTRRVIEQMYVYYINLGCTGRSAIGNETDEIPWENETGHNGFNPNNVWINDTLLVYHMAETNTIDSTGKNNATDIGSPSLDDGIFNTSMSMDGSNDALESDGTVSNVEGFNIGTIEAWINSDDDDGLTIFSLTDGDASTDYMIFGLNDFTGAFADESLYFVIARGGTTQLGMYLRDGDGAYTDGSWYHVAVVTGDGANKMYVNGVSRSITYTDGNAATTEFSNINNPSHMRAGNWFFNSGSLLWFNGTMDEVRVYNRTLNQSQISQNYWNGINNLTGQGAQENFTVNLSFTIVNPQNISYNFTSHDLLWNVDGGPPETVLYSLNGASNISLSTTEAVNDTQLSSNSFTSWAMVEDGGNVWVGNATGVTRLSQNGSTDNSVHIEHGGCNPLWCGVHANSTNVFVANRTGVTLYDKTGALDYVLTENLTTGGASGNLHTAITGNSTDIYVSNWNGVGKAFDPSGGFKFSFSIGTGQDDFCINGSTIWSYNINSPQFRTFDPSMTSIINYPKPDVLTSDNGIICNSSDLIAGTYFSDNVWNITIERLHANTTITAAEGANNIVLWGNNSAGNSNETSVFFTVDSVAPALTIAEPQNITYTADPELNFSYVENNPDTCWYSLNGAANVTLASCSTNGTTMTSSEGGNNVILYMNDTFENLGTSQVFWTLDTTPPAIFINEPQNITTNSDDFNFTFTEVDCASYSVDGGSNVTNCSVTGLELIGTFSSLVDNPHRVVVWANDSIGNSNETDRFWTRETVAPGIFIQSPTNTTFNVTTVDFNVTVNETADSCLVDFGFGNETMTNSTGNWNFQNTTMQDGSFQAIFSCNDTAGNGNETSVFFSVDTTPPTITIINPTDNVTSGNVAFLFNFSEEIDTAMYSLDGAANVTNNVLNTSWSGSLGSISVGEHNITVWANDTIGLTNETTKFFNATALTVPESITYYNQFLFNFSNPNVNQNATTCFFVLNNVTGNYTCGVFNVTINTNIGQNNLTLCWTNASGEFCNETLFNVSIRCSATEVNDTICTGKNFAYIAECKQIGATVYQFDYSNMTFCEFGCIDGTCINRTFCLDTCNSGEFMCNGNDVIYCKEKSDGCFDWSSTNRLHCENGCQDGQCLDCFDKCVIGNSICDGKVIRFCDDDNNDGCTEWSFLNTTDCEFGCFEQLNETTGINNVTCNFHSFDDIYDIRSVFSFGGWFTNYVFDTLNLKIWITIIIMLALGGIAALKSEPKNWRFGLIVMSGIAFISSWVAFTPWVFTILFVLFAGGVWFVGGRENE